MLPLNFNQLYYFWVAARSGSFSGARRTLLLTQPTLSLQVRQLERSLGKRLFERSRRGVTLTPDGRRAFEHCEVMFRRGEQLLADMKTGPAAARFRLALTHSVSRDVLWPLMDELNRLRPDAAVRVLSGTLEEGRASLARDAADLVVSDLDPAVGLGRDFRSRLVARRPVFFVGVPALARRAGRFPAALEKAPLLLRTPENPLRKEVDHALYRWRLAPAIEAETDDVDLLKDLLLRGRGVAAMPLRAVEKELASGRLVRLHPKPVGLWQNLWFCSRRRTHSDPRLREILDKLMGDYELL
jgi:LysR family transcriptional regulator, transcriptional activator of nhaA